MGAMEDPVRPDDPVTRRDLVQVTFRPSNPALACLPFGRSRSLDRADGDGPDRRTGGPGTGPPISFRASAFARAAATSAAISPYFGQQLVGWPDSAVGVVDCPRTPSGHGRVFRHNLGHADAQAHIDPGAPRPPRMAPVSTAARRMPRVEWCSPCHVHHARGNALPSPASRRPAGPCCHRPVPVAMSG